MSSVKKIRSYMGQRYTLVFLIAFFSLSVVAFGQDLENIGKEKLKITGGFGVDQNLYFSDGIDDRFNPYSYIIRGNLTASYSEFSMPVSFTYSNQQLSTSVIPFNIVGLSPTYKAWTLHAGYRNMSFSKYTLVGHSFLGGGLEYKKDRWNVAVMSGRLLKGQGFDSTSSQLPTYDRFGGGVKISYSNNGDEITLATFHAKDAVNSIDSFPVITGVKPLENHVYSLGFKKKLNDVVSIHFEGARSGIVKDTRDATSEGSSFSNNLYFMNNGTNVIYNNAFNGGVDIKMGKAKVGGQFERVESDYRTLGAYMMNTDFQNITVNFSRPIIKSKVQLSARAGFQRDDLEDAKLSKMRRFVGNINTSINFSKKLNATLSYSNFNSTINIKPIDQAFAQNSEFDRIDTMNYVQINQSFNGGVNYIPLESSNIVHNINLNANYSISSNKTPGENIANSVAGSMLMYTMNFKKSGLTLGLSGNGNINEYEAGESVFIGAGINSGISAFNKKVKIRLNLRANNNYENSVLTARLYSATNSYAYSIGKHQSISLNLRYTRRESIQQALLSYYTESFNEFLGSLSYNYRF